jgi:hypothetical protein
MGAGHEPWLEQLESTLADAELAVAIVTTASIAGREITLADDEARAAARRAVFVLAAGGDPERGLDLDGSAVTTFARDIDTPERRRALEAGLRQLAADSTGLPHVSEAVQGLLATPETAWRAFACSVLASHLDD